LAIAAISPDQVTACASVVGLAPFDAPGLDVNAQPAVTTTATATSLVTQPGTTVTATPTK
jgi:hypothetical protein